MKPNPIVEEYLDALQESRMAAAAYAAGKTIHTIAKPVIKTAGKVIKKVGSAVGRAGIDLAKRKMKDFKNVVTRKKTARKQGVTGALVKGLRGKKA
jgi:hypothetical protein